MYTGTIPADNEFKVYIKCYMGLCVLCVFVNLSLSGTVLYTCVIIDHYYYCVCIVGPLREVLLLKLLHQSSQC